MIPSTSRLLDIRTQQRTWLNLVPVCSKRVMLMMVCLLQSIPRLTTLKDVRCAIQCPMCYAKLVVNANISRYKAHRPYFDSKTYCLPSNTSTYNRQYVTAVTLSYTRGSNLLVTNKGKFQLTVKIHCELFTYWY